MKSTPKMNPIECRNGKIVAAFEVIENKSVLESKNTWDLHPVSPSHLKTTAIEDREWSKLKGVDLLAGFFENPAPTRKWLFFQDIIMLERLSRDLLTDNYTTICDGIHLYMANNAFALMRSCFVDGSEWNAYAIRLPARNGENFFWIKGAPKLRKEGLRYKMIRWIGLAAEFETSIEREKKYMEEWENKMTGKQKTLLLVRRNLGNRCEILVNQECDHLRVNEMENYAEIIEIKTWKEGEKEALDEINNRSFYSVSKLLDLEVVVLWNKKEIGKSGVWEKCLVESTKKYQSEKLTPKNEERLNEGNKAVRHLINELHQSTAEVIHFTFKNECFKFTPSTLEKFVEDLEGESEIGNYVKSTIDELKRHHQNAESRKSGSENADGGITSINKHRFDNGHQQPRISYASAVQNRREMNKEVVLQQKNEVDQPTVERFFKNELMRKDQVKGKSELGKQGAVLLFDNGKTSRAASNRIVSESNGKIATRSTSYAEAAKKRKEASLTPSEEKKTFDVNENNFPPLGNIGGKKQKKIF